MEFPFNLFDLNSIYEFATAQTASYWINLGVSILISTIVTGIILVIVMQLVSRRTGESIKPANAFLVVLLVNVINYFGIMGIMLSFIAAVPFMALALPAIIWILLLKLFFGSMRWIHIVIIGLVFYGISLYIVPYITTFIASFIPI